MSYIQNFRREGSVARDQFAFCLPYMVVTAGTSYIWYRVGLIKQEVGLRVWASGVGLVALSLLVKAVLLSPFDISQEKRRVYESIGITISANLVFIVYLAAKSRLSTSSSIR